MKTTHCLAHRVARALRRYGRNDGGAAATELALCVSLLAFPMLWVTEFGYYVYQQMEAGNATQAAAQAIWATCSTNVLMPATIKCGNMAAARDTAVASTSLGANVTVSSTTENYYCVVGGVLTPLVPKFIGSLNVAKPVNCAGNGIGGLATDTPGDYVVVTTSFTYTPIFGNLWLVNVLPTTTTRTAWTRIS